MENTLEIKSLSVQFGAGDSAEFAVKDVSFTLRRGEILGIVGESGSGKSVTCHALTDLLPAGGNHTVTGEALFCGTDLFSATRSEMRKLRGNRISMVFQDPMSSLNPYMTIGEQIIEPLLLQPDVSKVDAKLRAVSLLEEVGIVDAVSRFDDYPHMFSGGMRQRVLIAMALITDPEVLIADEPTSALDVTTQTHIVALLKEAQALREMSVIFISHDLGVVRSIADRVVVMEQGRVVEQGESWQVFDRPGHPYTRKLLAAIPRTAKPAEFRFRRDDSPDFLDVKNISVSFDENDAVDDVSFTVQQGETLGIVGESGSGKSTLSRAIVKLVRPDQGQVLFSGIPLLSSSGHAFRQQRKKVQMVFQDPYSSLNPRMTAHDIIAEPMLLHGITIGNENATKRVIKLMRDVGLPVRSLYKYPHEFSGGQCQRIAIARALASEPQLLVADEPVSALDVTVQAEILSLLLNLVKSKNLTMIFISHDLAVVRYVADRVGVMEDGRLVELGDTETLYANPTHPYTRTLIETTVDSAQD